MKMRCVSCLVLTSVVYHPGHRRNGGSGHSVPYRIGGYIIIEYIRTYIRTLVKYDVFLSKYLYIERQAEFLII